MKGKLYFGLFNHDDVNLETRKLIRRARLQLGLSLRQVCIRMGMQKQQLADIEKGTRPLPPERVPLIAKALKLEKEALIEAAVLDFRRKFERRTMSADQNSLPIGGDAA